MTLKLMPGQHAVFGYGSLLSVPSLERTLGRKYEGPFLSVDLNGWRRSWDAAMPNKTFFAETENGRIYPEHILYLNLRPEPGVRVNGTLFVVNEADVANFDAREWIYDRVDITRNLDVKLESGAAYVYVCKPEFCLADVASPHKAAIRSTYIDIVESGLALLGPEFRAKYRDSTETVPEHLVIQDQKQ